MVEQPPKKSLSLKRTPEKTATGVEPAEPPARKRAGKRVIRRDELTKAALGRTKTVSKRPGKKRAGTKVPSAPKKTSISPSEVRIAVLDKQLREAFPVWNQHQPLAIGIEKSVFRFIAAHQISASKRVVQKLLRRHTSTLTYQDNILHHAQRYDLDGSPAGQISQWEKDHAQRQPGVGHSVCSS